MQCSVIYFAFVSFYSFVKSSNWKHYNQQPKSFMRFEILLLLHSGLGNLFFFKLRLPLLNYLELLELPSAGCTEFDLKLFLFFKRNLISGELF